MQQSYVARILCAALALATLCPVRAYGAEPADILFSEVRWSGSPLSSADEWIEITNISQETIALDGWIVMGAGTQGAPLTIPEGTLLAPYTTYLIANYAMNDTKSVLATVPNLVTTTLSLLNTDIALSLIDAEGTIRDTWQDTGTPDAGSTSPSASAERDLVTLAWTTATTSIHLITPDSFGSPGFVPQPEVIEDIAPDIVPETSESETAPADASQEDPLLGEDSSDEGNVLNALPETLEPSEALPEETEPLANEDITPDDVFVEEIVLIVPIVENATNIEEAITSEENIGEVIEPDASDETISSDASESVTDENTEETSIVQTIVTHNVDYAPLVVTEFVSDPSDGTEWVEIWNSGETTLDLSVVTLADAAQKTTTLTGELGAGAYLTINNPSGKLNNSGDALVLALTDGSPLFTLMYGTETFSAPKKGFSAGMCAEGWHTDLVPTPGEVNACPSLPSYATSTTATNNGTDPSSGTPSALQGTAQETSVTQDTSSASYSAIASSVTSVTDAVQAQEIPTVTKTASTVDERSLGRRGDPSVDDSSLSLRLSSFGMTGGLDNVPSGTIVEIEGVVIAEPGLFGKRIAYLNGVQLYFHKAEWPDIPQGTRVRITGTWDHDADTRRIKISSAHDIVTLGAEVVSPASPTLPLASSQQDLLMTFSGTLVSKEGSAFTFALTDGQEILVRDDAKTGALALAQQGDSVTLTGILLNKDGALALVPRTKSDVQFAVVKEEILQGDGQLSVPTSTTQSATPLVGGGILASSVGALGYWLFRSQKLSFLFST